MDNTSKLFPNNISNNVAGDNIKLRRVFRSFSSAIKQHCTKAVTEEKVKLNGQKVCL
jgi:hypothetical protein